MEKKICFVSTAGGHFFELFMLREFWGKYNRFWVVPKRPDTEQPLEKEKTYWVEPVNRNPIKYLIAFLKALKILRKEKPSLLITSGANLGAVFIHAAKILKIETVYIELSGRIGKLSLSGRLVYYFADHFLVQWNDQAFRYKRAQYEGRVF